MVSFSSKCTFCVSSSILVSVTFTEVLMKDLARMLIQARKIKNYSLSFKMMLSICLVFLEKILWTKLWSSNFQNATFEKSYHSSDGNLSHQSVLSYRWFQIKIIAINTRNTMTSSYHSKVRSTQNKGVKFLFGTWTFGVIFSCLGEAKVSTINSDLRNFVDVQRLHENIK